MEMTEPATKARIFLNDWPIKSVSIPYHPVTQQTLLFILLIILDVQSGANGNLL